MKPTKEVSVYHIDDPFRRQLVEDFNFTYKGVEYTIKRGFWWDGASIPRLFWRSIGSPFTDKYVLPALIHDMFYATHILSRKDADLCFLEMMKEYGVGWVKRHTMYRSVRLGGWVGYNKSKEDIKKARNKVLINGE